MRRASWWPRRRGSGSRGCCVPPCCVVVRSVMWRCTRCCPRSWRSLRARTLALMALWGCGAPAAPTPPIDTPRAVAVEGLPGAVRASFEVGKADDWLALPWPNELRRRDDGKVDLQSFPARDSAVLGRLFDEIEREMTGFSLLPVLYVRFT